MPKTVEIERFVKGRDGGPRRIVFRRWKVSWIGKNAVEHIFHASEIMKTANSLCPCNYVTAVKRLRENAGNIESMKKNTLFYP